MPDRSNLRTVSVLVCPSIVALLLGAAAFPALSADLIGIYAGAAVGEASVQAQFGEYPGSFNETHSAFKFTAGFQPVEYLGAEIEYFDFGHPDRSGAFGITDGDVRMKGSAAFGVLYLPVFTTELFAKAGVSRIQSRVNIGVACSTAADNYGTPGSCPRFPRDDTDEAFAAGLGAQFNLGSLALRGETERFTGAGEHPYLWTVGFTWTFL